MFAGVEAGDDGIDDAGGAVNDVERRIEAVVFGCARGDVGGVFVGNPPGIDAVHVDAVSVVIGSGGARHHVEGGFGHVGVGMARGFEFAIELAFDRGDVDDVFVAVGRAKHERF